VSLMSTKRALRDCTSTTTGETVGSQSYRYDYGRDGFEEVFPSGRVGSTIVVADFWPGGLQTHGSYWGLAEGRVETQATRMRQHDPLRNLMFF